MKQDTPKALQKVMERRRLLRGTFAAPAVFTLSSGSALAAQSSARAIAYLAANPQQPLSTSDGDTSAYVRVRRYVKYEDNGVDIKQKWVCGAHVYAKIPAYAKPGSGSARTVVSSVPNSQWFRIDNKNAPGYGDLNNNQPRDTFADGWVVLRVSYTSSQGSDTITIVGVSDDKNGFGTTSALTASAWTSFVTGP